MRGEDRRRERLTQHDSGDDRRQWGAVARRGARWLASPGDAERTAVRDEKTGGRPAPVAWQPEEVWVQDPNPPETSPPARVSARGGASIGHRYSVPAPVVGELTAAAGAARGERLAARLGDASHAYERERYEEARRLLRPIVDEVPGSAAAKELYGLTLYRLGQWAPAARQLEAVHSLGAGLSQHPALADCYRAMKRYDDAERCWRELREASPDPDLVAEGRIVAAGCLADQGDLTGAIRTLEPAARRVSRPLDRHLRLWYALGDLYERAGDLPKARELFGRVASADPDAFDVRRRMRSLR